MSEMLSVIDLAKVYASGAIRYRALDGVSFQVRAGEFVAVVGESGSGKSTLAHICAGLERPTAGKVYLLNRPIHAMRQEELSAFRGQHVGFVFQQFFLLPQLSALENVALPLIATGVGEGERTARARELLTRIGLKEHLLHMPGQLSGGQQQRVAIARALIAQPALIIADEPTGNLDGATADGIVALLIDLVRARGATLMMITHDAQRAKQADRLIRLRGGRVEGE